MERKDIYPKLNEIFADVFDIDDINVTDETNSSDIEEWDSLANIHLIIAIQKQFGVKFSSAEIIGWKNVGEMIDSIIEKC